MKIRKEIELFDPSPDRRYGAVYCPVRKPYVSVCYLIPLNIPLRLGYLLWLWCQTPFIDWEPKWYWPWFEKKAYPKQETITFADFPVEEQFGRLMGEATDINPAIGENT